MLSHDAFRAFTFDSRVGSQCGGEQGAEAVQVGCRTEAKLDPVAPGPIAPDGGIGAEALLDLRPARPGDPQVDHAGRLPVGDLPAGGDQGRLVAIARPPFRDRARGEQGGDESLPQRITMIIIHHRQGMSGTSRRPAWLGQDVTGSVRFGT
jgi:hypothetical protein